MAQKYARGMHAWGICARSGKKMLLKDMVFDEQYPNLRVDPEWFEPKHPQEFLPKVEDPVALYRPAVEVIDGPLAPIALAVQVAGTLSLTWSPSETGITEIASYSIYKGQDGVTPVLLITCKVLRDFLGGIIGVEHCTTVPSIPADDTSDQSSPGDSSGSVFDRVTNRDAPIAYLDTAVSIGHTYCYYVIATPMGNNQSVAQGPPSAPSNTTCVAMVSPTATTPVLSEQLQNPNVVLTWTAATVIGGSITNYQVWRSLNGGAFSLLTTVGNVLTYTDTATTPGFTNQYFVIAIPNFGANSSSSNIVTQIIPTDPFYDNVVLMLHFDGTNGSTAIVDSSKFNNTMTAVVNATLATANPKFGTAALSLPDTATATGSRVVTPITNGSPLDILSGTADFTIDGWFLLTSLNTANLLIFDYGGDLVTFSDNHQLVLRANNGGVGAGAIAVDTAIQQNNTGAFWPTVPNLAGITISPNVWHHFAVVRSSGLPLLFVDGQEQTVQASQWVNYIFPATSFVSIGWTASELGGRDPGLVDEFRVTKGIARWTSNFTPPTAPTLP